MKLYLCLLSTLFALSVFAQTSNFTTFKILPSKEIALEGDTIDYQIIANNFNNVIGIQWGIQWDSSSLKLISNSTDIYKSANTKLNGISYSSFNFINNNLLFVFVSSGSNGITLSNNDSIIYTFRAIAKKNDANTNVCFSNNLIISELVYLDASNKEVEPSGKIIDCNQIKFDPKQLLLTANSIVVFTQFTPSIKLSYTTKNGYPPIHSDWGIAKDQDSIIIDPPKADSVYNLKVWDASNDTIFFQYFLRYKRVGLEANFTQEYVDIQNVKKIKLSLYYTYYNGKVTIDWGSIKDTNSIIIDQPTKDSIYSVILYDDTDTIKHNYFIKPFTAIQVAKVVATSIEPFDENKIGLRVYLNSIGLKKPIIYSCVGAVKVDSNIVLLPSDNSNYLIVAKDSNGSVAFTNVTAYKVKPKLSFYGDNAPKIDQSNLYFTHYNFPIIFAEPIKYIWENGDSTYISSIKRPSKDSTFYTLSIVDANGLALRDSVRIIFNKNASCNANASYNNNQLSISFYKNPQYGLIKWSYNIVQNNTIIQSKNGLLLDDLLQIDFENQSFTENAYFELKYSMNGKNYSVNEKTLNYTYAPKTGLPLFIKKINDYRFCNLDTIITIKSGVYGGVPPLHYSWSNGEAGLNLDSINVQPTQNSIYKVIVVDAIGKSLTNDIPVTIGDSLSLMPFVLKDTICPNKIEIPIHSNNPFAPFILEATLEKNNGETFSDTLIHSKSDYYFSYDEKNYSNQNYEKLIIKIKTPETGYCIIGSSVEQTDTVILKPTPKFQYRSPIKQTVCMGNNIQIELPTQDSSNLLGAKISYTNNLWVNDNAFGNFIYQTTKDSIAVNYPSIISLPFNYQDVNYYFLNQFKWKIKYDFNECEGYDNRMIDSVLTIKPVFMQLYSKYQTINSGQEIQPIRLLPSFDKLNYQWKYSENKLGGTLFSSNSNPIMGNINNKTNYDQILKIALKGEIEGCPTNEDTAYITVKSLYVPYIEIEELKEGGFTGSVISSKLLKNNSLHDLSVFPNPVKDQLFVEYECKSNQKIELIILNTEGKIMYQTYQNCNLGNNQLLINLTNIPSGIYFLKLNNQDGNSIHKFVKI